MASNGPPQTVARFLFPSLFRGSWLLLFLSSPKELVWFGSGGFVFYSFMPTGEHPIVIQLYSLCFCLCVYVFFLHGFTDRLLLLFTIVTIVRLQCIELNVIAVVCLCYCCTGRGSSSVCKDICGRMWGIFLLFFFCGFSSIIICCCVDYGYYYCLVREL